jgi:hypothetical protein
VAIKPESKGRGGKRPGAGRKPRASPEVEPAAPVEEIKPAESIAEAWQPRDWRWAFLAELARTACVTLACRAARVSRDTAYRHRERFPRFRAKWDEALTIAVELLEGEAHGRAFDRADTKSAQLLMFLLRANRPDKYRLRTDQAAQTVPSDAKALRDYLDANDIDEHDLPGETPEGPGPGAGLGREPG